MSLLRRILHTKPDQPAGEAGGELEKPFDAMPPVVASSARISAFGTSIRGRRTGQAMEWQDEAWAHYRSAGELQYIVKLVARMMSRCPLFLTMTDDDGVPMEEPPSTGPDGRPLPIPFGSPALQAEILYDAGIQLGVPGDGYLIGEEEVDEFTGEPTGYERWEVVSVKELTLDKTTGEWVLDKGDGVKRILDPDRTVIVEFYEADPEQHALPTSQVQANFRPLRTLERAAKYVNALLTSRLAGNGILAIPNEFTFATADGELDAADGASSFFSKLTDSFMSAIDDPDSVEALVPIVIKGPGDRIGQIKWIRMDQELSDVILKIETEALRRLGLGLDVPPEMMTGVAQTNHWTAWQLDESTISYQVATKLELFCAAVTREFIWPSLAGAVPDYRRWVLWFSTKPLTQPQDKSADAKTVFEAGELSGEALRRESGFTDEDAPTDQERQIRLLMELARAIPSIGAQLAPAILAAAGLGRIEVQAIEPAPQQEPAPADSEQPADEADPNRTGPPEERDDGSPGDAAAVGMFVGTAPGFVGACEALVLHALSTAGKRLIGRDRHKYTQLQPWEYHTQASSVGKSIPDLLKGGFLAAPTVAWSLGVDPQQLVASLARYTASLISAGRAHSRDELAAHLAAHPVAEAADA